MRMNDAFWMEKALRAARSAAARGEVPVGCVIVKNGRLLARSGNGVN